MNPPQNDPCEMLSAWLKVATDRLCDSAKSRITLEIEAHFNEAVQAHLADGRSLIDAQGNALDELGDPKRASRRFLKKHVTQSQLEKLKEWEKAVQKQPSKLVSFVLSLLIIVALACHHDHDSNLQFSFIWLLCVLIPWARYLLQRIFPARSTLQSLILVSQFFGPPFVMAIVLVTDYFTQSRSYLVPELRWLFWTFFPCLMVLLWFVAGARSFHWFRIWRKVRNELLPES
jgi:hypothetical protein